MRRRPLRVLLALLGFLAIYVPVVVLFLVTVVTEDRFVDRRDGAEPSRPAEGSTPSDAGYPILVLRCPPPGRSRRIAVPCPASIAPC